MRNLLLATVLPVLALTGCYHSPYETMGYGHAASSGYVLVDGHWYWAQDRWLWTDGYYVVDRPGYSWVNGTYLGRVWQPGYWSLGAWYGSAGHGHRYARGHHGHVSPAPRHPGHHSTGHSRGHSGHRAGHHHH